MKRNPLKVLLMMYARNAYKFSESLRKVKPSLLLKCYALSCLPPVRRNISPSLKQPLVNMISVSLRISLYIVSRRALSCESFSEPRWNNKSTANSAAISRSHQCCTRFYCLNSCRVCCPHAVQGWSFRCCERWTEDALDSFACSLGNHGPGHHEISPLGRRIRFYRSPR